MSKLLLTAMMLLTAGFTIQTGNPLLEEWKTPFETPPFNSIRNEHYLPAFEAGMKAEMAEIAAIADDPEKPTFRNTIGALEKSGRLLERVSNVFGALNEANTSEELQNISQTVEPLLTKHRDDISLNPRLFARIRELYDTRDALGLDDEERTLLDNYYKNFVRSGANLGEEDKAKLRAVNEELSNLYLKFRQNHLNQTNAVALVIDRPEDLAGLPEDVVKAAAAAAKAKGMDGKWAFTLQKPSFIPFLQYSTKRNLREVVYKAYVNRGNNGDQHDNKRIIAAIAALRVKRSNLLGYATYADFVLERNMAKKPENVYKFLNDLWTPALKRAKAEVADMQAIVDREGGGFRIAGWDWWHYAEKVKKEKYDLDESMLRPYFRMEGVRKGAFDVAEKLYGIRFVPRTDIQPYAGDVEVFEVKEADGRHLGIFYTDYYPRDGKRAGAWSDGFRSQSNIDGKFITPLVFNVGNFSKPTADKPSLMSVDEVQTLFHELGHALNSLFGNTVYSGSRRTPRDFVELPSQIMENWAMDPEVLRSYAVHYETGEPIPQALVDRLQKARTFNQGFETVEYLAASFLDMDWHMLADPAEREAAAFENESLAKIGLIEEIAPRYTSTNFSHIFSDGGYAAGYYSYVWAEVLDADAFQAFREKGLFDRELAASFRTNILSRGSTDMMAQYVRFRGAEPKVDALLKRRGLE